MSLSPVLAVRVQGPIAVFSEPAFKAERLSYPVMTPSAARGIIEAVLWKPAIAWRVERIQVLAPIRFVSIKRNEVTRKAPAPSATLIREGGAPPVLFADDDRAQRNTVALRDVDYVIEARFQMTPRAGPEDNVTKFVDMFKRRVAKGQHFAAPYLGCREYAADVMPADHAPPPIPESRRLGHMLWDIVYRREGNRAVFFDAELRDGILHVPREPEGLRLITGSAT